MVFAALLLAAMLSSPGDTPAGDEGAAASKVVAILPVTVVGLPSADGEDFHAALVAAARAVEGLTPASDGPPAGLDPDTDEQARQCLLDPRCMAEVGDALGAHVVVVCEVHAESAETTIRVRVLATDDGATVSEQTDRVPSTPKTLAAAVEQTARRALSAVVRRPPGTLVLRATDDDAAVIIDGATVGRTPLGPLDVGAGEHLVVVEKDGFFRYEQRVDIAPDGAETLDVTLAATPEYAARHHTVNSALRYGAYGLATLGALTTALGVVGLAVNAGLAYLTTDAIKTLNADPTRTQEEVDQLALQAQVINLATPTLAVVAAAGVVPVVAGAVVFLLSDDPDRYE